MNLIIDEAADAVGRGPQAVRRIYNISGQFGRSAELLQGTPTDWAEQLAQIAVTEGMSTFILGTDDADDLRRFAAEVVPAVRELVLQHRGGTGSDEVPTPSPSSVPVPADHDQVDPSADLPVDPTPDDSSRLTGSWPGTRAPDRSALDLPPRATPRTSGRCLST